MEREHLTGTRIIFCNGFELTARESTREIINQGLSSDRIVVTRLYLGKIQRINVEWNDMAKLVAIKKEQG
ncbi:hypothetical protein [Lactobacillus taiwanensis]|uniref:hypothetical protein n=1 Tax=Lactobacillus taiwanensis TaxID=508451 RepID=UPI0025A951F4|nr:hypothetical protein [Lactobacillus taiwanensis]